MFLELLTLRIRQILNLVREVRQSITICINNEPIAVPPIIPYIVAEMLLKTVIRKTIGISN